MIKTLIVERPKVILTLHSKPGCIGPYFITFYEHTGLPSRVFSSTGIGSPGVYPASISVTLALTMT